MKGKKLTLLGSICLILIFAVIPFMTACPAQPEEPVVEEPVVEEPVVEKSVLRVAWDETPPAGMNVLKCNSTSDLGWNRLIYEPLWTCTVEGDTIPWLAKSWEYKEDEKAWIVNLDERATWSDGQPVTAEDVKFTFEACIEYNFTMAGPLGPFVDSIKAVDDHTVRFNMAGDYAHFIMEAGGALIVPEHIWSKVDDISQFTNPNPVGSGPFLFKELVQRQYLHAVKNPNYWRGPVAIDKVVYKVYSNIDAALMALETGEIDVVPYMVGTYSAIPTLEADPNIQFMEVEGPFTIHLMVNHRMYPLNLKEMLQAMSLVIDRKAIVETVFAGHAEYPLMGFLPPGYEYYADPIPWPGLDMTEEERIAEANAMLDDLGFKSGKDGIRVTDKGAKMEFRLLVPTCYPAFIRGCEIIKNNLAKVGIAINVLPGDAETVYAGIIFSGKRTEDWDLFFTTSIVRGIKYYCNSWAGMEPNPWRNAIASGFEDEELQPLLRQVHVTMDKEQRKELLVQAQKLFAELLPSIVMCHRHNLYAYRTDKFAGWDNTHIIQGNFTTPTVSLLTLTSLHPK